VVAPVASQIHSVLIDLISLRSGHPRSETFSLSILGSHHVQTLAHLIERKLASVYTCKLLDRSKRFQDKTVRGVHDLQFHSLPYLVSSPVLHWNGHLPLKGHHDQRFYFACSVLLGLVFSENPSVAV